AFAGGGAPGLDPPPPGGGRGARRDGGAAGRGPIGAPLLAQRPELSDPAHVALAPRGHAVAHPMFLGDDLAVKLVLLALLFLEHRVAPFLEMGKAALDPTR